MPERYRLRKPIGPNHVVEPGDVVRTKSALAGLGFFEPPDEGITPWPDRPMIDAVTDFQRAYGLKPDGVINRGGPTEEAINAALAAASDFGDIPGMETIRRRIGVEALDPTFGGRLPTEVDAGIDVGPPFAPPPSQWPGVDSIAARGGASEGSNAALAAGGGHLGMIPGMEGVELAPSRHRPPQVPVDIETGPLLTPPDFAPEGGWPRAIRKAWEPVEEALRQTVGAPSRNREWEGIVVVENPFANWLIQDPAPLVLRPEVAQLIVDMGRISDRDEGFSPKEERSLHVRAARLFRGSPKIMEEFTRRIGDLRHDPLTGGQFDPVVDRVGDAEAAGPVA